MNKKVTINGFDEKQVFSLYSYLVAYEESGIQKYTSTKSMLKEHPELSSLEEQTKDVTILKSTATEMKEIDFKEMSNKIYCTKDKGNLLLSFLSHLRNSIAHGSVVELNGHVLITDFANPRFRPIDFTARGRISFQLLHKITTALNKIIL